MRLQIHNGNLTNAEQLRATLRQQSELSYQRHLKTESDTEVLLNIFADEIHRAHKAHPSISERELVFEAVGAMMGQLRGSYSIISLISQVGLLAFRDPHGIRPLVLGHRTTADGNEWCFASEDCAFSPLGFTKVRSAPVARQVEPMEPATALARSAAPCAGAGCASRGGGAHHA